MKKTVLFLLLAQSSVLFAQSSDNATNNSDFKKANGVEYKIVKDADGRSIQIDDLVELNVVWKVGKNDGVSKDTVVVDTRKTNNGKPVTMTLTAPKFVGDMTAGLSFFSAGDSGVIRVSVDSIKQNLKDVPLPDFAKDGDYFIYEVNIVSVKSKEEAANEQKLLDEGQKKTDDRLLNEYFVKHNIKPLKTASGLYYIIQEKGTGDKIAKGKSVTLKYTGKLLDGTVFDSNEDPAKAESKEPFVVKAGEGMVIEGFDEGLLLLKKGAKATLYIPSGMAYGRQSMGGSVPENAIMIFDIRVTSVK